MKVPDAPEPAGGSSTLRRRAMSGRPKEAPLRQREKCVLGAVLLAGIFPAWNVGGTTFWADQVNFILCVTGFLLLFIPVGGYPFPESAASENIRRLVRFPVFWLGLAFLAYLAVGRLNPMGVFQTNGAYWWLQASSTWDTRFPTSVIAPIEFMNPWREILRFSAPWLLVCAIWAGIRRRKSLLVLGWVIVLNASVFSVLAFLQRVTGVEKILWMVPLPPFVDFYGSFIYQNAAAMYLYLCLALTAGLAFYHWREQMLEGSRGGLPFLLSVLGGIQFAGVAASNSRGSILMAVLLGLLLLLLFWYALYLTRPPGLNWMVCASMGLIVLAGLMVYIPFARSDSPMQQKWERLSESLSNPQQQDRIRVAGISLSLFEEKWFWGWGAGSYRYIAQEALRDNDYYQGREAERGQFKPFYYAHSDWVQFPLQYGVAGASLAGSILAAWCWLAWRARRYLRFANVAWLLGPAVVFLQAVLDFPFYNPPVLTTFCLIIAMGVLYADLRRPNPAYGEVTP